MNKLKVIKKIIKTSCYCCSSVGGKPIPQKECNTCNGTGIYKDYHYIFITGKYAIDSDTLK